MGRPKLYSSTAEKHRAYRARLAAETVRVDRVRWAELEGRANRLAEVVAAVRSAGCPVAAQIHGVATDTVPDALIAWFERQAEHPWAQKKTSAGPSTPRRG